MLSRPHRFLPLLRASLAAPILLAGALGLPGCGGGKTVTPPVLAPDLRERVLEAPQGKVVDIGPALKGPLAFDTLERISYNREVLPGPLFCISDDPEYFREPEGCAFRETVKPGVIRLYTYHVNGVRDTKKKITTVIENLGTVPMTVRFIKSTLQGPSLNYHAVGRGGLVDFFSGKTTKQLLHIPVGGAAPLDAVAETKVVQYDELIHGFYEFDINQPARISVIMTDPSIDSVEANKRITKVLKRKGNAGRGQFPVSNYKISLYGDAAIDTATGPRQLIVADGKQDPWIAGVDTSVTTDTLNKGNYGVVYDIELPYRSTDGRSLALLTWNPRSQAKWCGKMTLAMEVSAGKFPGGLVQVPNDAVNFGSETEAAVLQVFPPPPPGETSTIKLRYSPPGACCLPVPFLFVPVETR